jgi:hypothetical protein
MINNKETFFPIVKSTAQTGEPGEQPNDSFDILVQLRAISLRIGATQPVSAVADLDQTIRLAICQQWHPPVHWSGTLLLRFAAATLRCGQSERP